MTKTLTQTITDNKLNKLINDHMNSLPKIDELVKGRVLFVDKYEILVDIDTFTTGVVRGREIKDLPEEYQKLKPGDEIQAMVLDLENEKGQMELSLKGALIEGAWQFVKEKEKTQEIIEVKIKGANKGGLLANIRGIPAFLPVSQLNQEHYPRVEGGDKKKILKKLRSFIGKVFQVKIISFDPEQEKIIISEKRAWEQQQRQKLLKFKTGDLVQGTIKNTTNFGAFIEFANNLEGLIHISEVPQDKNKEPIEISKILKPGDKVKAKIVDIKGTRVFLSLKNIKS